MPNLTSCTPYAKWCEKLDIFFEIESKLIIVAEFDHMDLTSLLKISYIIFKYDYYFHQIYK
jgi:hypothetical protein